MARELANERLLRQLSVKSGWKEFGIGGVGQNEFTRQDILAAMSKVDKGPDGDHLPSAAVMYYYIREPYLRTNAVQMLFHRMTKGPVSALEAKLKPCVLPMCFMAVEEVLGGLSLTQCKRCRGKFEFKSPEGEKVMCKHCFEGMRPSVEANPHQRSKTLAGALAQSGVMPVNEVPSRYIWNQHLADHYDAMMHQFSLALSDGMSLLRKALEGDERGL